MDTRGPAARTNASVRLSPDLEIVQQSRAATAHPIDPNKIAITFPDGTSSAVSARQLSPPRDLPATRLLDEYEILRKAAESGDGSAAEALYRGLNNCRMAYTDEKALNAAISVLRKERVVKLADGSLPTAIESDEDVDVVAESALRDPFEYCKGITAEQKGEAEKWLDVAANQGNLRAMRIRAALLDNTEEAVREWETAWRTGDRLALEFLGKIHSRGISDSASGAPDHVRAYAHAYLNLRLLEGLYANSPPGYFRRLVGRYQAGLAEEGGHLNPQQYDEAVALAKEMIAANPNCCFVN